MVESMWRVLQDVVQVEVCTHHLLGVGSEQQENMNACEPSSGTLTRMPLSGPVHLEVDFASQMMEETSTFRRRSSSRITAYSRMLPRPSTLIIKRGKHSVYCRMSWPLEARLSTS